MANVNEIGRFLYVEPNNMGMDAPDNVIPYPYEDYCLSVNLEVQMKTRISAAGDDGEYLYFSSDNGTISFFGGSGNESKDSDNQQGYLSTNWTDVSATNVGSGNKECLGIESINITYDSWYFPMVTIKFVDVRGASLMMPQEKAYQTEVSDQNRDITQLEGGSFFKSLFTFPYPVFILRVKGFYGKQVAYKLAVAKQSLDFDSENGNFTCTVDFKGHMYGVYTDVPMTYIAVAPYLDGMTYWQSQIDNKRFCFKNTDGNEGLPMLTFPELRAKITKALSNIEQKGNESPEGKTYEESTNTANEIINLLDNFNGRFGSWTSKTTDGNGVETINTTYFQFNGDTNFDTYKTLGSDVYKLIQSVKEYDELHKSEGTKYSAMLSEIENHLKFKNENKPSEDTAIFLPNYAVRKEDGVISVHSVKLGKKEKSFEIEEALVTDISGETIEAFFTKHNEMVKTLDSNTGKTFYLSYFTTKFVNEAQQRIKDEEAKQKKAVDKIGAFKMKTFNELLGFNLSVENVYRLVFAHFETFMHYMLGISQEVKKEMDDQTGERNIDKFGGFEYLDIPYGYKGEVMAWPLCTQETSENGMRHVVAQWPEDVVGNEIPETKFVVDLLKAAQTYSTKEDEARADLDRTMNGTGETETLSTNVEGFIPTTPYDFVRVDKSSNPYAHISEFNGSPREFAGRVLNTFFLRAFYFFSSFGEFQKDKLFDNCGQKYFGTAEAANFKKGLGSLTEDCKTALFKYDKTEKALDYMGQSTGDEIAVWKIGDNAPFKYNQKTKVWKDCKYQWLNKDNSYALPICSYDIERIKSDYAKGTYLNNGEYIILGDDNLPLSGDGVNEGLYHIDDSTKNFWDSILDNVSGDKTISKIKGVKNTFKKIRDARTLKADPYYADGKTIFTLLTNLNKDDKSCKEDKKLNGKDILELDKEKLPYVCLGTGKKISEYENWCSTGAWDGKLDSYTPFCRPQYRIQGNDDSVEALIRKAYIFVFSIPTNEKYHKQFIESVNCVGAKAEFLQLGAFLWRKEEMKNGIDPLRYVNGVHHPSEDEVPVGKDGGLVFYAANNGKYPKYDIGTVSNAKRKKLIAYFKEWAKGAEFANILKNFDSKTAVDVSCEVTKILPYGKDSKDYLSQEGQSALMAVYGSTITPFDCGNIDTGSNKLRNAIGDAFEVFIEALKKEYEHESTVEPTEYDKNSIAAAMESNVFEDADLKKSTYLNLKNLYDKWLCGKDEKNWMIDGEKSDFKNFQFLDSLYNDIGQKFLCNASQIRDLLGEVLPTEEIAANGQMKSGAYQGQSVYEFLALVAQKNQMTLFCLPLMPSLNINATAEEVEEMFRPHSYLKNAHYVKEHGDEGETYICIYAYKPSANLDIRDDNGLYLFEDDSFDIADIHGDPSPTLPANLQTVDNNTKNIPSFGVTYAKQNQSMFKKIGLSTKDQQVTEQSLMMTQMIAAQAGETRNETTFYGQDVYRIYANNCYSCTVECMGNSQIMPLMYFQLNNIPMWRGAYLITKVEHSIVAGDMVTRFTGTRQCKSAVPFSQGGFITVNNDGSVSRRDEDMNELPENQNPNINVPEKNSDYSGVTHSSSYNTLRYRPIISEITSEEEAIVKEEEKKYKPVIADFDPYAATARMGRLLVLHPNGKKVLVNTPNANTNSQHRCAEAVRQYIEAGKGESIIGHNAYDFKNYLPTIGFRLIKTLTSRSDQAAWTKSSAQAGDIAVMAHGEYGHICMFTPDNGSRCWISDFAQNNMWVYKGDGTCYIFRYNWS